MQSLCERREDFIPGGEQRAGGRTCSAGCTAGACPGPAPRRSRAPGAGWRAVGVRSESSGAGRATRVLRGTAMHAPRVRPGLRASVAPGRLSRSASCGPGPRRRRGRGARLAQAPPRHPLRALRPAPAAIQSLPRRSGPERPHAAVGHAGSVKLRTAVGWRARAERLRHSARARLQSARVGTGSTHHAARIPRRGRQAPRVRVRGACSSHGASQRARDRRTLAPNCPEQPLRRALRPKRLRQPRAALGRRPGTAGGASGSAVGAA